MIRPGLVRFILATIVVFFHLSGNIYIGTMAVYCFFILSGYWVTFMYERKYSQLPSPILTFYYSRVFRIFPVYLLVALMTAGAYLIFQRDFYLSIFDKLGAEFVFSNVFILGYNLLQFKTLVPAWSLDIELQFYLLIPVLVFLSKNGFVRFCLLFYFTVLTVAISAYFPSHWISNTILPYLVYFFIGIIIYRQQLSFDRKVEYLFNIIFLIVLVAHYSLSSNSFYHVLKGNRLYANYFNQIISLLTIPLLCNSVRSKSDKFDRMLGEMSYVLYLIHWMLLIPYNNFIVGASFAQRLILTAGYLGATFLFAYLVYIFFDKPVDQKRRIWLEKRFLKR